MILYLEEYADDWAIFANVWYAMKKMSGSDVRMLEKADLSHLPDGEPIWITGHGMPGFVGSYIGGDMAELLINRGLKGTHPIKLLACDSAIPFSSEKEHYPSFAEALCRALRAKGVMSSVTGIEGLGVNSVAIGERVTFPDKSHLYMTEIQDKVLPKLQLADPKGALFPISVLKSSIPEWADIDLSDDKRKAEAVGGLTRDAYVILRDEADKKGFFRPVGQGLATFG